MIEKRHARVEDFIGGWIIGDFDPAVEKTSNFELALKTFALGEREPIHHQLKATEVTVVVSGLIRMGNYILGPGDILRLEPGERADFEALEISQVVAVKFPSLPGDKRLVIDAS